MVLLAAPLKLSLTALRAGFGSGVLFFSFGCLMTAFQNFVAFLIDPAAGGAVFSFVLMIVAMLVPLLLAFDVAGASSDVQRLKQTLNEKRMDSIHSQEAANLITRLEQSLSASNGGQGVGFVAGGRLVDRQLLASAALALGSVLGAALPVVLALQPQTATGGAGACACANSKNTSLS